MIPRCEGCKIELEILISEENKDLHFAGSGLFEKGHLFLILVNDKGEVIVG